jgi:formylglycine-generating enzyme required for sulfatase activity
MHRTDLMAVRIREPLGERSAGLPLVVGGAGAGLVVPGAEGSILQLEADGRGWRVRPVPDALLTLNGQALREATALDDGDVLGLPAAQLVVHPSQAIIDVVHLAGNATVAPLQRDALPGEAVAAGVREIVASGATRDAAAPAASRLPRALRWGLVAAGLAGLLIAGLLFALVPVPLQLAPAGTRTAATGLIHWQSDGRISLLPGRRELLFSHAGYRERQLTLEVTRALADAAPLQVTLEKLPGQLAVDTGGVAAQLLVDGAAAGTLPGEVELAAGTHELVIRAPKHIDHVARIDIEGGGARQQLAVQLQPSIGTLALDTAPAGASVSIDGKPVGAAPQRLDMEAGLHRLAIAAPGRRAWQGEVAIIAGQVLDLGRIDLALPPPAALRAAAAPAAAGTDNAGAPAAPPVVARTAPPARLRSGLLGTLVLLPAGKYLQGSDRREQGRRANEVQREVTLTRAFYLADTEVTNAQFRAFRASHASGIALDQSLDLDRQAVTGVSWADAVEFCNWLSLREGLPAAYERRDGRWQLVEPRNTGYRLPTEAEWEYAARRDGQAMRRYAWGDALPPPARAANLAGQESLPKPGPESRLASALPDYRDEHAVVAPVGSYLPEASGLHDLGGNVSEWMHDVYVSLPEAQAVSDPMGAAGDGAHGLRGPNWRSATIASLRLAWRERASGPGDTIGFRVARYAEELP